MEKQSRYRNTTWTKIEYSSRSGNLEVYPFLYSVGAAILLHMLVAKLRTVAICHPLATLWFEYTWLWIELSSFSNGVSQTEQWVSNVAVNRYDRHCSKGDWPTAKVE